MSELLGRDELREAFRRLADHLRRRRVVGHIYVVGGAAMVLAYDAERITRDVDALLVEAHGPITDAAFGVAAELGLPRSWLNEQASSFLPRQPDDAATLVVDYPNLKVTAASPRHVVAMKARAARPRDLDDLGRLADLLELSSLADVIAIHDAVFPDDTLPERTLQRLRVWWTG